MIGRAIGSASFNLFFFAWLLVLLLTVWAGLRLPPERFRRVTELWPRGLDWALRTFCGIDYEVRGRANLPDGPAILAVKHQSSWETGAILRIVPGIACVMKAELMKIPTWKRYVTHAGHFAVDRAGGGAALRRMIRDVQKVLDEGRPVAVFPEGTRTAPGTGGAYHPGIAALYAQLKAPVVPVALNSGLFWGRRSFLKHPGTIVIEFLPPMPPGLDRAAFTAELRDRIETATRRLEAQGRRDHPELAD